jgi:hypothetical protein
MFGSGIKHPGSATMVVTVIKNLDVESSMALLVRLENIAGFGALSGLPSSRDVARGVVHGVALCLRYATLKLPATERFLTLVGILFQSFAAR